MSCGVGHRCGLYPTVGSDWTPSLGTSIRGPKKKKKGKERKKEKKEERKKERKKEREKKRKERENKRKEIVSLFSTDETGSRLRSLP